MKPKAAPKPATLVIDADNRKIGRAAATYASIDATCPACPWKGAGCYAQEHFVGITSRRLDAGARAGGFTPEQAARYEAALIVDASTKPKAQGRALRLHVSGDARTRKAARILGQACKAWPGKVWTYTHAYKRVPRIEWGPAVSVLASVESLAQVPLARAQGYAPARVVDHHPEDGRAFDEGGVRWIPCPQQTRGVQCADCGLCFAADALFARGAGIQFAAHGAKQGTMKRHLQVVR